MEGFDVECLDDNVSSDLYCIICLKLMRNAIQMRCGHGMCKSCFNGLVHSCGLRNTELNCPSCRKSVVVDEIVNVPMIDRIITSLKVKCSNNKQGCQWIGKLETLESHFEKCEYSPVQCSNKMCVENVPRYEMEEHLKSCSYGTIDCIYRDFGCDEKVMRNDMDTHIKSSPLKHLEMMSRNIQEKDKTIERLQKENDCLQNQLHEMKQQNLEIIEFQKQLSKANAELKDMISQIPEYHLSVNALNEELKATRAKIDELNNGRASGAKHVKCDKEKGASVSVEIESSKCTVIDDKEVIDSLQFIVFRGELFKGRSLSQSDITSSTWNQFQLEYKNAETQWATQGKIFLEGASDNIEAKMKFSDVYWETSLHTLTDKLKKFCSQQIYRIELLCRQFQYLRENVIKSTPTITTSVCIGKFRYSKENYAYNGQSGRSYSTNKSLSCFGDHQVYINQNGELAVYSESAKAVMVCDGNCLKTLAAKEVSVGTFVFGQIRDPFAKLVQSSIQRFDDKKEVLLKIQEK